MGHNRLSQLGRVRAAPSAGITVPRRTQVGTAYAAVLGARAEHARTSSHAVRRIAAPSPRSSAVPVGE
ncbi:hypothetical protein MMF93_15240 [Streptomyces tubbatahanensis]|uniref:Uncharacterized protein n=1 Tax=Streptomyces tubbatahanensis TaxID=2923272 RepID=A0ABY3XTI7_9ACTN|nr:hypothetical protein [Streptomyces tubbatahanensis]UNS97689.1 hypothetical protein MMF93_15240 [Streptomyces tubbatahanensis]